MKEETEDSLFRIERRNRILSMLHTEGKLMVNDTAKALSVTGATIRKDLTALEEMGLLERTHGGAIAKSKTMIDRPLSQRNTERLDQKQAIAETALQYTNNSENIFLDGGTTLFEFATVLNNSQMSELHIITNFLPIISLLESSPKVQLVTLGGAYDESLKSFVGPLAKEALDSFYLDTAFISTTGLDFQQGLSCTNFQDAELRRQVLARSKKKILLADSSKINRSAFITVAKLTSLDTLITDWEIREEDLSTFRSCGIEVVVAERKR